MSRPVTARTHPWRVTLEYGGMAEEEPESGALGPKPRIGNRVLAEMMRAQAEHALFGPPQAPTESEADAQGTVSLGRFRLQAVLGRGGMGDVFAAYDPELRRPVAIKLLRSRPDVDQGDGRRLRREAAAIARLSHPNIVQVFDVGEAKGQVYIAMELVEGVNLRTWLVRKPRTPREIIDIFLQAGQGLAAAHGRGIVHRDFKMGNVLVGDDGRVRVIDFGLARRDSESLEQTPAGLAKTVERREVLALEPVTATGQAMGTPGYMAPEQRAGQPAVAATDQYAFCVSVFEALTGIRPRPGAEPDAASVDSGLSPALERALRRGMAERPEQRWPSMGALLEALTRGSRVRRKWHWPAAGVLVGVSALGLWSWPNSPDEPQACDLPGVSEVWNDERRRELSEAVAGAEEHAAASEAWLLERIDRHAQMLEQSRGALCDAPGRDEGQRACLARRYLELEVVVEALGSAASLPLAHGPEVVASMAVPSLCEAGTVPEGPNRYDAELQREIVALGLRLSTREPRDLRDIASRLHEDARGRGSPAQVLEVRLLLARASQARGQFDEAATRYEAVYLEAHGGGHDAIAAEAASRMTELVHKWSRGADQALLWAERVCSELRRLGGDSDAADCERARARAQMANGDDERALGSLERVLAATSADDLGSAPDVARTTLALARVHLRRGHAGPAQAAVESARRLVARSLGRAHPRYAEVLVTRAALHDQRGDYGRAMADLDRALILLRRALGKEHPAQAEVLERRSRIFAARGELGRATELTRRVLELRQVAMDSSHIDVAKTYYNLGLLLWGQGKEAEAELPLSRAKDIYYRTYGPDHIEVAPVLELLGHRASRGGEPAEALRHYDQALKIRRAVQGADHASVAMVLDHRFEPLLALGRGAEAEQAAREAIGILEAAHGPEHPRLVPALVHLGQYWAEQGELRRGVTQLDRAIEIGSKAWGETSANLREPLVVRAELALSARRYADAERDSRRALAATSPRGASDETSGRIHRALARALRARGRAQEAAEHERLAEGLRADEAG